MPINIPKAPKRIECAPRHRIAAQGALVDDFIQSALGLDPDWTLITDESSLWDFHGDENNDALLAKTKEIYGVDVTDVPRANVAEILERISVARQQ